MSFNCSIALTGTSKSFHSTSEGFFELEEAVRELGRKEKKFLAKIKKAAQKFPKGQQTDKGDSSIWLDEAPPGSDELEWPHVKQSLEREFIGTAFDKNLFSLLIEEQLEAESFRMQALRELENIILEKSERKLRTQPPSLRDRETKRLEKGETFLKNQSRPLRDTEREKIGEVESCVEAQPQFLGEQNEKNLGKVESYLNSKSSTHRELETERLRKVKSYLKTQPNINRHVMLMHTYLIETRILNTENDIHYKLAFKGMCQRHKAATRAFENKDYDKLRSFLQSGYQDELFSKYMLMILIKVSTNSKPHMRKIHPPRSWFFHLIKRTEKSALKRAEALWELSRGNLEQAKKLVQFVTEVQQETRSLQKKLLAIGLSPWDSNADMQCKDAWAELEKMEEAYLGLPELPALRHKLRELATARYQLENEGEPKTVDFVQRDEPLIGLDKSTIEWIIECNRMREILARHMTDALKHEWEAWISYRKRDRVITLRHCCQAQEKLQVAQELAKGWAQRDGTPLNFTKTKKYLSLRGDFEKFKHPMNKTSETIKRNNSHH